MARVSPYPDVVADASVVIAFLNANDANHGDAVALIGPVAERRGVIYMHRLNLAEVLVGPIIAGRGREVLEALTELGVVADDGVDEPYELAEARAATRLKMPEVCAVALARRQNLELLTVDQRMRKAVRAGT